MLDLKMGIKWRHEYARERLIVDFVPWAESLQAKVISNIRFGIK